MASIHGLQGKAIELAYASDLSSFSLLQRGTVSDVIKFTANTVSGRTASGQGKRVEENQGNTYAYARSEGITGVVITGKEYPQRVAFSVIQKALDEYLAAKPKSSWNVAQVSSATAFSALDDYVRRYQDPQQVGALFKVQQD